MDVLDEKKGFRPQMRNWLKNWLISFTIQSPSQLSMTSTSKNIFEKDKTAAVKYQHEKDLEQFLAEKSI